MKTGVDLRNVPGEQPLITTGNAENHILFDSVSNCTLDGFILDDSSRATPDGHALIYVFGSAGTPGNGLAIRNCTDRPPSAG